MDGMTKIAAVEVVKWFDGSESGKLGDYLTEWIGTGFEHVAGSDQTDELR